MFKPFIFCLQFLTILPVKIREMGKNTVKDSTIYFPLAGFIIGALTLFVYLAALAFLPRDASLVLSILSGFFITGGLHIDGLADTCDALMSGRRKKEFIAVMRDSSTGAGGSIGIASDMLLRFVLLRGLPGYLTATALLFAPFCSRFILSALVNSFDYPESTGKGKDFISRSLSRALMASVVFIAPCALLFGPFYLFVSAACLLFCLISAWYFSAKLGGLTGDLLGFHSEISEIAALALISMGVSL